MAEQLASAKMVAYVLTPDRHRMFSAKSDHGVAVNNLLKFSIQNILQSAAAERGSSAVAAAVSAAVAAAASRYQLNWCKWCGPGSVDRARQPCHSIDGWHQTILRIDSSNQISYHDFGQCTQTL